MLNRLDELCGVLFADVRIQCVFTVPEPRSEFDRDIPEKILAKGGVLIAWQEAISRRFDLAIAASPNGPIELLHAPLMVMQHGPALVKAAAKQDTRGMLSRLARRSDNTVVLEPADPRELGTVPRGVVVRSVGDPVYDSLLRHIPLRQEYRAFLGVGERELVVVSSTWGPNSLLSRHPSLVEKLLAKLPANEYVVALVLHPYAWSAHGEWQIRTWLRRELAGGLRLIPQQSGWQGAILAAGCAIGDHGSVTHYAAACGVPTMTIPPTEEVDEDVPLMAQTRGVAEVLRNIDSAIAFARDCAGRSNEPLIPKDGAFANVGNSVRDIQRIAYELMGLSPDSREPGEIPVAPPHPIRGTEPGLRTKTVLLDDAPLPILRIETEYLPR